MFFTNMITHWSTFLAFVNWSYSIPNWLLKQGHFDQIFCHHQWSWVPFQNYFYHTFQNDNNGTIGKFGLQSLEFEFLEIIKMKKHKNQSKLKCWDERHKVVDSTIRIINMSPFSNPLRNLTSISKFSILTYNCFLNNCSCI
jgi:hypothetical protein